MYLFHRLGRSRWGYGFRVPLIVLILIVAPLWLCWHLIRGIALALVYASQDAVRAIRWAWKEWHTPEPDEPRQ